MGLFGRPKMIAVEFNWLMSMIHYLVDDIPKHAIEYGLSGTVINILPAYPKDLTQFKKPSIIIQKVNTMHRGIGMGNVLGEYFDDETGATYDIYGKLHHILAQIDVVANSRTQCGLISSVVGERSLNIIGKDDRIPMKDFICDMNNPVDTGIINISRDIDIMDMTVDPLDISAGNDDYRTIIRFDCKIIQPIFDANQDMVDLSKGIKWSETLRL